MTFQASATSNFIAGVTRNLIWDYTDPGASRINLIC